MELRESYKNTEVGVIPEDWEVKEFGELTDKIIGGGTPSRANQYYWGNDIPWMTVKDFVTFNSSKTQEYITTEGLKNSSSHLIPKGTIITSTRMALGKAVIYDVEVSINQDLKAIFTKNNIDNCFFYYWFRFNSKLIEDLGSGSTVLGLSLPDLKKIKVILPPTKKEQTAIATALSDADALINSLEKLIAKKRNIKQGAMQQLLKPKEGWEVRKLGESADIFRGGSPRPIENFITTQPNGINWIKIGDVGKGDKFIETTEEKIIQEGVSRSRFVNEGDFLLSNSMSFGRPYILKTNGCIHDGWLVIHNYQNHFDREFLYYVLGSESILAQYKAMASGSSVLNLNKEIVKNVLVNCPVSKQEQTRIATIFSDMDAEIQALETKLEKYRKIKLGMMQNLLTGRIRLVQIYP